ncbi:DUF58 domain-containing protein [Natronomonas marina]|uniref:DUF58 domain-containing protein n=1 Tax=Natronomonas marina TaxID=2961939 RepID=UPI0020CA250B|nr:DUF58 domain-containing protein [Natronomonas marina]
MTRTNRWVGLGGAALVVVGVAVLFREPGPVLAAGVAAGYLAVRSATAPPTPSLRVERTVETETPDPDEEVRIEVTVENEGATLYDLRLVDEVPDGLAVVDGPARHATALRGGDAATFSYTVRASRGSHEWEDLRVVARDPLGVHERETTVDAPSTLRCVPTFEGTADLPLRGLTTPYAGRVPTDVGGSGIEFYAVREYRRGDPQARVDWNRAARTGELATLELREERAATVVLVVDARTAAYVAPSPEAESAVERSVDAAGHLADVLLSKGDRVGATAFSPRACWLAPGTGTAHRARLHDALVTDPGFAPTPPDPDARFVSRLWRRRFRRRLPADAQVMLFSPCVDRAPLVLAERLNALGHLVTVVSPDPTPTEGLGGRVVGIERDLRLAELRASGVRVLEWSPTEPFAVAGDRAGRRWSG